MLDLYQRRYGGRPLRPNEYVISTDRSALINLHHVVAVEQRPGEGGVVRLRGVPRPVPISRREAGRLRRGLR